MFNTSQAPCTSKILRVGASIAGPRQIHNNASRIAVTALPMQQAANVALPRGPAFYVLQNHDTVYLGETVNAETRLIKHLGDPTKAFAREALVVTAFPEPWLNTLAPVFLQHRFWEIAQAAGQMNVANLQTPTIPAVPEDERGELERYFEDARQALFDAGCRAFDSVFESRCRAEVVVEADEDPVEPEGCDPMQIDVLVHPPAGGEFELRYTGLWARGYPEADGAFVVMPGSEFRSSINASTNKIVKTRRTQLQTAGALEEIPGSGRERLVVGVRFTSASVAGKVVTGAHVNSGVWVQRPYAQPILVVM